MASPNDHPAAGIVGVLLGIAVLAFIIAGVILSYRNRNRMRRDRRKMAQRMLQKQATPYITAPPSPPCSDLEAQRTVAPIHVQLPITPSPPSGPPRFSTLPGVAAGPSPSSTSPSRSPGGFPLSSPPGYSSPLQTAIINTDRDPFMRYPPTVVQIGESASLAALSSKIIQDRQRPVPPPVPIRKSMLPYLEQDITSATADSPGAIDFSKRRARSATVDSQLGRHGEPLPPYSSPQNTSHLVRAVRKT